MEKLKKCIDKLGKLHPNKNELLRALPYLIRSFWHKVPVETQVCGSNYNIFRYSGENLFLVVAIGPTI